ncbi:hypothetical protein AQUSIP_25190 [Aquicella siphonis]|uniref:Glutamine cyclotransferase n=1 Tax=Aquicella siphonis TaxID=254247 RepID=A0A5E4PLR0_9COXI|nr:glutaminyl-peptide cyclotransferase [Aquicella siphonis]VVC77192.1 hypothetical protein AQUSIP_25190 [Aquicella siphonis]
MNKRMIKIILSFCVLAASLFVFMACKGKGAVKNEFAPSEAHTLLEQTLKNAHVPEYQYQVITTSPHDKTSFTEGFLIDGGYLYESTGLYKKSKLRKIEMMTGKVLQEYTLPPQYFAEGIAVIGDLVYQLTYKERTGFVYNKNTFSIQNTFHYQTDGWGLTNDDQQLIMSNGSSTLFFIDPKSFKTMRTLTVAAQNYKISSLNELEYVNGSIYANVLPTDIIIMISPQTGQVTGWINIKQLYTHRNCPPVVSDCIANGIAYNQSDDTLLVTGKNWPFIYTIKIEKKNPANQSVTQ